MSTLIVTTNEGRQFAVVIVETHDRYGRDFCLVNADGPMVEFWDMLYQHGPVSPGSQIYGQFVSRYNLSTMVEHQLGYGLNLDGGVPAWSIDRETFAEIQGWLDAVNSRLARERYDAAYAARRQ